MVEEVSQLVGSSGSVFNARHAWVKAVADRVNGFFFDANGSNNRRGTMASDPGMDPSSTSTSTLSSKSKKSNGNGKVTSTTRGNDNPNITVRGIVLAGAGPLKTDLFKCQFLNPAVKAAIVQVVDVSYGGKLGFHEAISKCATSMGLVRVAGQDQLITDVMDVLHDNIDMVTIGVKMCIRAVTAQTARRVVLSYEPESDLVDQFIIVVKRGDALVSFRLARNEIDAEVAWRQVVDSISRRGDLVIEAHRLRDYFRMLCEANNCELELVGVHSPLSVQFAVGFGGCVALLYAAIDFTQWDDIDELEEFGLGIDDGANDEKDLVDDLLGDIEEDEPAETLPSRPVVQSGPRVIYTPPSKEHVTLVMAGHVDAGKSTIAGQILLQLGSIDEHMIRNYEQEAKARNRSSWWISYLLDQDDEERNRGKTVECGRASFETDDKRYTIMDAPGHANYVPNMINGATMADVGLLVISARVGEFEAGFERGGQTIEHAQLIFTLGIRRLVVVINKMDCVGWSRERYDEILGQVRPFLKRIGFKKNVSYVPVSGQSGLNIRHLLDEGVCGWFDGLPLLGTLDNLKPIKRRLKKVLRISLSCRAQSDDGSVDVIGKIESGVVSVGDNLVLSPIGTHSVVERICIDDEPAMAAGAGENVLLTLSGISGSDVRSLRGGLVGCPTHDVIRPVKKFVAQVFVLEAPDGTAGVVSGGYSGMLHVHNEAVECLVTKVVEAASSSGPPVLFPGDTGQVEIEVPDVAIAVDEFEKCPSLGRFTIRSMGSTILIGKIVSVASA